MTTNLLTANQASFEGSISGWAAPTPPPVNLLFETQSTMEGPDAGPTTMQLAGWVGTGINKTRTQMLGVHTLLVSGTGNLLLGNSGNVPYDIGDPSEPVTFMVAAYCTAAATITLRFQPQDAAGTAVGALQSAATALPAGTWTTCRLVATLPTGATRINAVGITGSPWPAAGFHLRNAGLYGGDVTAFSPPSASWRQNLLDAERADAETDNISGPLVGV